MEGKTEYEVRKFQLIGEQKEVHYPENNESVAVCWNLKKASNEIETWWAKTGNPYIGFVWVREDRGTYYEDEDGPTDGGVFVAEARAIAAEILIACEYLESLKGDRLQQ